VLESLPTKGKPIEFFFWGPNGEISDELMQFIYMNYPAYALGPYEILQWLQGEAYRIANEDAIRL